MPATVVTEKTVATFLTLPPELHFIIFSYLEAEDQGLAPCLPSTRLSSWAFWQKSLVLTCRRLSQLLEARLHEQMVMPICSQCCGSKANFSHCEAGCSRRWHKLIQPTIASRIIRLEVRPIGVESVNTITAGQISSAIANSINLQQLR